MTGGEEGAVSAPVTHVDPSDRPECRRYQEITSAPLATIRKLSKEELVRRYNELLALKKPPCNRQWLYQVGPDDYLAELNRRVAERQARWLIGLTVVIAVMTAILIAIELGWLRAVIGH